MNALTEMANVLSVKDEALTRAISLIGEHIKPCDVGTGDEAECFSNKICPSTGRPYPHYFWCVKGKAGLLVQDLREAFKAR
jgi:hypothetical protein